MRSRAWVVPAGLLALGLGACSSGDADATGGAVELAVSHTCLPDVEADAECVPVRGEHVVTTSDFQRAGIDEAWTVADDADGDTIHLTFDDDGTAVLESSSEEVARAGETARLLIRVDDDVLAAVRVPEPLTGGDVLLAVPGGSSAEDLLELIRGA